MKTRNFAVWFFCLAAFAAAHAQQKPPAGRTGLDPASRSKVGNVMARSYLTEQDANAAIEREMVTSPTGKNCNTHIGTAPATSKGIAGVGSRYGSGNADQVTVVRGSVISICK